MGNDLLNEIVRVEEEVRQRLDAARESAVELVADAGRERGEAIAREEERLRGSLESAVAEARKAAEQEADSRLREAEAAARRLAELDDETLRRYVAVHLNALMAGAIHDRQDVEN